MGSRELTHTIASSELDRPLPPTSYLIHLSIACRCTALLFPPRSMLPRSPYTRQNGNSLTMLAHPCMKFQPSHLSASLRSSDCDFDADRTLETASTHATRTFAYAALQNRDSSRPIQYPIVPIYASCSSKSTPVSICGNAILVFPEYWTRSTRQKPARVDEKSKISRSRSADAGRAWRGRAAVDPAYGHNSSEYTRCPDGRFVQAFTALLSWYGTEYGFMTILQ